MRSTRPMDLTDESARPRLAPHVRMRFDTARRQHTLLSPEAVLVINDTGAAIVELCDGRRTVAQIRAELHGRYDRVADDEVHDFVAGLVNRHALEMTDG